MYTFIVRFDNQVDSDVDKFASVTRSFEFYDGYPLLQVDTYLQGTTTIDLADGPQTVALKPPLFKDDMNAALPLLDPTNPARSFYFKIVGHETKPVSDFILVQTIDNTLASEIKV